MPIIRGYTDVVDAIRSKQFVLARPFYVPHDIWNQLSIDRINPYVDFNEEGAEGLKLSPMTNVTPVLVYEDSAAILLIEYNTQDKGKIPTWCFELTTYSTITGEVLNSCKDILSQNGIRVVENGRPDNILNIDKDFQSLLKGMSSRVTRAYKGAISFGVETTLIPISEYAMLMYSKDGIRIRAENALHHVCTQFPESINNPDYWIQRNFEGAEKYALLNNPTYFSLLTNTQFICFKHIHRDTNTLLGLSLVYADSGEWFWIGTHALRSGESIHLRSKFNLMYAMISHLIDFAYRKDASSFNLGIRTFGYKEDFTTDVKWYPGLEYM